MWLRDHISKCDEKKNAPLAVIGQLEVQGNRYISTDVDHVNSLRGGRGGEET